MEGYVYKYLQLFLCHIPGTWPFFSTQKSITLYAQDHYHPLICILMRKYHWRESARHNV
jgi:hypothetical protein